MCLLLFSVWYSFSCFAAEYVMVSPNVFTWIHGAIENQLTHGQCNIVQCLLVSECFLKLVLEMNEFQIPLVLDQTA